MADYDYLSTSNGSGDAALMHVQSIRLSGSTTIDVDTVVNVPDKFIGTYGTLLPNGLIDPVTKRDFKGHVSGADLIIDAFEPGSTDAGNVAGQVVIVKPNTGWANRVAQFMKNMTGLGTPESITADDIEANTLSLATIPQGIWANYTPVMSNTVLGNGTISGQYLRLGELVFVQIKLTLGTTTTVVDPNTQTIFTLPVTGVNPQNGTASSNFGLFAQSQYVHSGSYQSQPGGPMFAGTTETNKVASHFSLGIGTTTGQAPGGFAVAAGDVYYASFCYQAA